MYVAFGASARLAAKLSIESLLRCNDVPVVVVCDGQPGAVSPQAVNVPFDRPGPGARRAKLNVDKLVPQEWRAFAYIDADTFVHADLSPGFAIVEDGWDVAITPSAHQGAELFWHVSAPERRATVAEIADAGPLQLQGGVLFVCQNERTAALFAAWRAEWERWRGPDQAALVRALYRCPLRVWLLGRPWNGGALIHHRWGAIKGS